MARTPLPSERPSAIAPSIAAAMTGTSGPRLAPRSPATLPADDEEPDTEIIEDPRPLGEMALHGPPSARREPDLEQDRGEPDEASKQSPPAASAAPVAAKPRRKRRAPATELATDLAQTDPPAAEPKVPEIRLEEDPTRVTFDVDGNRFHTIYPIVITTARAVVLLSGELKEGAFQFEPALGTVFTIEADGDSALVAQMGLSFDIGRYHATVFVRVPKETRKVRREGPAEVEDEPGSEFEPEAGMDPEPEDDPLPPVKMDAPRGREFGLGYV